MIRLFHSISRVIIVQDFETNFLCVICIQADLLLFSVEKVVRAFQVSSMVFSSYTFSHPNLSLLVRGYIEVKIKQVVCLALTQITLRCLKYIKGNFNPYAVWHSCFLIPSQSFYRE